MAADWDRSIIDAPRKRVKTRVLTIRLWPRVELNLGRSCFQLGAKLRHIGPNWSQVGPRWELVSRSQIALMLRRCWIETVNLDDVVPICRICKLPQRGASFWRGVDPENATSKLKLYQRTEDCSKRSAPLLNYHASAPSVRADSIIYLCLSLSIIYICACMYVCIFISIYICISYIIFGTI